MELNRAGERQLPWESPIATRGGSFKSYFVCDRSVLEFPRRRVQMSIMFFFIAERKDPAISVPNHDLSRSRHDNAILNVTDKALNEFRKKIHRKLNPSFLSFISFFFTSELA